MDNQTWFAAALVSRFNWRNRELTIRRPNVSTLLYSAFIRGYLNAATRGPLIRSLIIYPFSWRGVNRRHGVSRHGRELKERGWNWYARLPNSKQRGTREFFILKPLGRFFTNLIFILTLFPSKARHSSKSNIFIWQKCVPCARNFFQVWKELKKNLKWELKT